MKLAEETPEIDPEEAKATVVKLSVDCKRVIQDIWECKDGVVALNDLNKVYREKMKELQNSINLVENLCNEVDEESTRMDLKLFAESQQKQLEHTQTSLRKANLSCKLAIDNREKDMLLGSREVRAEQIRERRRKANKDQMSKAAAEVTENLLSISKMIEGTVKESSNALGAIEKSSNTIKHTNKELKDQGGLIQTSHRLLTKLNRRECTDKILIIFALILFFGVVLYIIRRRIFGMEK